MTEIEVLIENMNRRKTKIKIFSNQTIRELKEYYGMGDPQFKCDGEVLQNDKSLDDYGIEDGDFIISNDRSKGGGGLDMADISNEKGLNKGNYSKNAKKWNIITEGLNVNGKCQNSSCEAYDENVDCKIGMGSFDLVRDADQIKCPMCHEEIEPMTCTFCECQYRLNGKKKVKGKTQKVETIWKRVEKDFEFYDPQESGIVCWLMLIIETKPL